MTVVRESDITPERESEVTTDKEDSWNIPTSVVADLGRVAVEGAQQDG